MAERTRRIPSRKIAKAQRLCVPNPKNMNKQPPSPMTLLERLREAVFRFIMLCALSKPTNNNHHHHPAAAGASFQDDVVGRRHFYDHHHNEAVADCIEFIKKKAYSDEHIHDADADVGPLPLPVR